MARHQDAGRGAATVAGDRAAASAATPAWIYCAGCGNPCRAPSHPGQYVCPRCGRRLSSERRVARVKQAEAAGTGTNWRVPFLIAVTTLVALIAIRATVARMAGADQKVLVAEGLRQEPFLLSGDTLYLRTVRSLHQVRLPGGRPTTLTRAPAGLGSASVTDGYVYWVTRQWGLYPGIFEIRRLPLAGGTEQVVLRLEDEATFPPGIAVVSDRLYVLANRRTASDTWQTRLLRFTPAQNPGAGSSSHPRSLRREAVLLAQGAMRPSYEFLVDQGNPDRVYWLRYDELRERGEAPGAVYEVTFPDLSSGGQRGQGWTRSGRGWGSVPRSSPRVRRLATATHPYALAHDEGKIYWFNDLYSRPRLPGPGGAPLYRTVAPRVTLPADSVQLQILAAGVREPRTYTLPAPPAGARGVLHRGDFYWLALPTVVDEREARLEVLRLSLATGRVAPFTHVRSNSTGASAWFVRDRSGAGLYLFERYLFENWFDWSAQGLSPRQLGRIWRLKVG